MYENYVSNGIFWFQVLEIELDTSERELLETEGALFLKKFRSNILKIEFEISVWRTTWDGGMGRIQRTDPGAALLCPEFLLCNKWKYKYKCKHKYKYKFK